MKLVLGSLLFVLWLACNVLGMTSFHHTMMRVFGKRPILKFLTKAVTVGYSLLLLLMIFRWAIIPLLR